jgi:DNA repair protein RadC
MDLSLLDRGQLEAVLLDPPVIEPDPLLAACDSNPSFLPPPSPNRRDARLRQVLAAAHELLVRVAHQAILGRTVLDRPALIKEFLKVRFAGAEREIFVVLFLDTQGRVIAAEDLFAGTLSQAAVYPREVVRRAMLHNAATCVVSHYHPGSAGSQPTRADEYLTRTLKEALQLVDVRLLDHLIVSGNSCTSFAEQGLM